MPDFFMLAIRRRGLMDVRRLACIALVSLSLGLIGCGDKKVDLSKSAGGKPFPKWIKQDDGTVELEFGDLLLRIPPEPQYSFSPPFAERWGWSRGVGWTLEAPTLQTWKSSLQANGRHSPDKLANIVRLDLYASGSIEPVPKELRVRRSPDLALSEWASVLRQPILNTSLGLLEYRNSKDRPYLYASPDEQLIALNGQRPFVICPGSPMHEWGGYRYCDVQGWLSSQVRYRYEFSDKWLGEWPDLERKIQQFLRSRIVGSN